MLQSKKRGVSSVAIVNGQLKVSAFVGLDTAIAPHADEVIWGTSKMIPRNFLLGTLSQPDTQLKIRTLLSKNLRDFVFRFRGLGLA